MPLPKIVAAGVCTAILGAQLWATFPISKELRAWYWPFVPYPMYAVAHARDDSFVSPALRVATCGSTEAKTVLTAHELGVLDEQLRLSLIYITVAPNAPRARREYGKLTRAIEAQHPGRFCTASVWMRVVKVSDTTTHHAYGKMREVAAWAMRDSLTR